MAHNILKTPAFRGTYNFRSNLMLTYFTLQFFKVEETTFSHVSSLRIHFTDITERISMYYRVAMSKVFKGC